MFVVWFVAVPQDKRLPGGAATARASATAYSKGEHQLRFLVDTVKHEAGRGTAIVVVMRHFERFTERRKQTLLHNLFDLTQNPDVRLAIIGLSTYQNVTFNLEKRIQVSGCAVVRLCGLLRCLPSDQTHPLYCVRHG